MTISYSTLLCYTSEKLYKLLSDENDIEFINSVNNCSILFAQSPIFAFKK